MSERGLCSRGYSVDWFRMEGFRGGIKGSLSGESFTITVRVGIIIYVDVGWGRNNGFPLAGTLIGVFMVGPFRD